MNESHMISLAAVSHELRNPLALIHSTLQIIGSHYPEIKTDPMWPQMIAEIQYMSQLLTDLSSLNKSQTLHCTVFDIRQVMNDLMERFSYKAENEGKCLKLKIETEDTILEADRLKIKEMLLNLIQNALEATQCGDWIEVGVRSKREEMILSVQDSGVGMDAQRCQTIFEPFVTYRMGGTGLGLSIVKSIADNHHGTIQVDSRPDEGTKFVIVLPKCVSKIE